MATCAYTHINIGVCVFILNKSLRPEMSVTLISWLAAFSSRRFFSFFFCWRRHQPLFSIRPVPCYVYQAVLPQSTIGGVGHPQKTGGIHFNARRDSNEFARPFLTSRSPLRYLSPKLERLLHFYTFKFIKGNLVIRSSFKFNAILCQ